jgi:hypothetical protein
MQMAALFIVVLSLGVDGSEAAACIPDFCAIFRSCPGWCTNRQLCVRSVHMANEHRIKVIVSGKIHNLDICGSCLRFSSFFLFALLLGFLRLLEFAGFRIDDIS